MFGLGMTELILIAAIALIVVGPKRLPDIAKSLGKGYGEFKKTFGEFKESINLDDVAKDKEKPKSQSATERYADKYKSEWETKVADTPKSANAIEAKPVDDNTATDTAKSDEKKG